jgi:hypothetical protein
MMRRPNLVIVHASESSLHERWIAGGPRNFDMLVLYGGDVPGRFASGVEHYRIAKGPRWPVHEALFARDGRWILEYERVALVSDDVDARLPSWNTLFGMADWYALDLAQPAATGYAAWEGQAAQPGCLLRYTSFVESTAPVFSRRALERVRPTFAEGASGADLPLAWSRLLPWPEYRCAIVDTVVAARTRPAPKGTFDIREHARLRESQEK